MEHQPDEQEDVLTSLWHWAISQQQQQDRAVHLCSTSDHVLNVVSVSWAVNVCVVTIRVSYSTCAYE